MVLSLPGRQQAVLLNFPKGGRRFHSVVEIPTPTARNMGPLDVLVRSLATGICGTDFEIREGEGHGGWKKDTRFKVQGVPKRGLICGHEACGVVVGVGNKVTKFRPGDLVVPVVRCECTSTSCNPCQKGRWDYCMSGKAPESGIGGRDGFLCEYWVRDQNHLVKAHRELGVHAALTEPFSVGAKAVGDALFHFQRASCGASPRNALIVGVGAVGIGLVAELARRGIPTVGIARSPNDSPKAKLFCDVAQALDCSARYVSVGENQVPLLQLNKHLANKHRHQFGYFRNLSLGFDLVFDVSGNSNVALEAIHLVGRSGVYGLGSVTGGQGTAVLNTDSLNLRVCLNSINLFGFVNNGLPHFCRAVQTLSRLFDHDPSLLVRFQDHTSYDLADVPSLVDKVGEYLKITVVNEQGD